MMEKIIVVAFHMGRIGSSALMGLLKLAGINVGSKDMLFSHSPMNPKGFFESKIQEKFLREVYKGYYPDICSPPSIADIKSREEKYWNDYYMLLCKIFKKGEVIAVKSQRMLTLPFLNRIKNNHDIKIIILNRNEEDQVKSILRIWKKIGSTFQKNSSFEFVLRWIQEWKKFSQSVVKHYNFTVHYVDFEKLFSDTEKTLNELFCFLNEKPPSISNVKLWLDKSLVNRITYRE